MTPLFGTDGIRGLTNTEPMTATSIQKIAAAVGVVLRTENRRHWAVIGKDTRLSGYMIESALVSGLVSVGIDVMLVGPLPTPAIAMLTRSLRADLGIMISASHNPYHDNGIKIFGSDGCKISSDVQTSIETMMEAVEPAALVDPDHIGHVRRIDDAPGRYIEFVKNTFPKDLRLDGLKIVVDCAHGAAYRIAPTVFWELGAEVVPLHCAPNGMNINLHCGATSPASLQRHVLMHKADLGLALDGDGDRVILCDEQGQIFDGDQILAVLAQAWAQSGILKGGGIVTTVMSNLGLELFLAQQGLRLIRTPVGDKYVAEMMRREGMNVGGEPSGHMIFSDYTFSGDGLVAALQVLAFLKRQECRLSTCRLFQPVPQHLSHVSVSPRTRLDIPPIQEKIIHIQQRLGAQGRIIVRPSGTEPLVRIMVEGPYEISVLQNFSEDLAQTILKANASGA